MKKLLALALPCVLAPAATFEQAGLGDIRASNWWGVGMPKGTPPKAVKTLYGAFRAALDSAPAQERVRKLCITDAGVNDIEGNAT